MPGFCEFVTKIQARRNEWDATCKGTGDTINYRTMERDLVGLHRQTQGALGDTKNYGHGRGSAHMKVEPGMTSCTWTRESVDEGVTTG